MINWILGVLFSDWRCPLCYKKIWPASKNVIWAQHGGGISVCVRCVKNRKSEIDRHNEIYWGNSSKKKDPNCPHVWHHPFPGRWFCAGCGAGYRWMCGHGGSEFVCDPCYGDFIVRAGNLNQFLAEKSW